MKSEFIETKAGIRLYFRSKTIITDFRLHLDVDLIFVDNNIDNNKKKKQVEKLVHVLKMNRYRKNKI